MIAKVALYVCPVPGCAMVGKSKDAKCPAHPQRAVVREIYEHKPKRSVMEEVEDVARKVKDVFGDA